MSMDGRRTMLPLAILAGLSANRADMQPAAPPLRAILVRTAAYYRRFDTAGRLVTSPEGQ